jgi:hypothetical protein
VWRVFQFARSQQQSAAFILTTKAVVEDFADHELQHSELHEMMCINCHQKNGIAEKKIVKFFNHPHKDMVLRSNKIHAAAQ